MKLSDLIFESQILLEEKFAIKKTPSGRTWGVYNTTVTPNVLISSHKTRNQARIKLDQLKNPTAAPSNKTSKPSKADRNKVKKPVATKMPSGGLMKGMFARAPGQFTIIFPDGKGYVDINNETTANKFQKHIETLESQGKTPKQISDEFTKNRTKFLLEAGVESPDNVKSYKRNPIKRAIKKLSIADFEKEMEARKSISKFANSKIMKWTLSPAFKSLKYIASFKLGTIALGYLAIFIGTSQAIADVEGEIAEATDENKIKELQEEYQILLGQATIMMGLFVFALLKDLKSVRALARALTKPIRTAMMGLGMVAGGVAGLSAGPAGVAAGVAAGAKGGAIARIVMSEGLGFLFFTALMLPAVQRFIAELLQGYWLGDAFAFVGTGIEALLKTANDSLDGRFGTGFLADKLTIDQITKEGPDGEYFSDSEWAKLVFGALLFPDGEKTRFVPYMPEAKREDLMTNLLSPENSQPKEDPDANDPRVKDQIPPAPGPQTSTPGLPANPDAEAVPQ